MHTLVLLQGGHKTLIKNTNPSELERQIVRARRETFDGGLNGQPIELLYLQQPDGVANRVVVDPRAVVGLIAVDHDE